MRESQIIQHRLLRWSAIIVVVGLVLIFMQLAAQIAFDFMWPRERGGGPSSSYIGLVVLLIGAVLMALIALSSRSWIGKASDAGGATRDSRGAASGPGAVVQDSKEVTADSSGAASGLKGQDQDSKKAIPDSEGAASGSKESAPGPQETG